MKQKTKRRIQGSISVLLVIILLPSMVLTALMVDSARINMARAMVSSAGDLALNTTLANYDTILKDVYGLFAMSQLENKSEEQLSEDIKAYFVDTLVSYGVVNESEADDYVGNLIGDFNELLTIGTNVEVSNFMNMEVGDFKVIKQENSGLDNPEILRKQIVDYMKYRGPVNFGLSFLDSVKAFTTIEEQSAVVEAQVKAQEKIQPVTEGCRTVIDAIREYDDKVESMMSGDKAVKGKESSTDSGIVLIDEYSTQLDKYKDLWGVTYKENYKDINEMNLVFLVKSVDISDKYLVKKKYAAQEYYVGTDKLNSANSGISVEVSLASDFDGAEKQTEDQRQKLMGDTYSQLKTYNSQNYLGRSLINIEKTAFSNRADAANAFVKFEGFLSDDNTLSPAYSYSKIAEGLEALEIYQKYHDNYMAKFNAKITEAQNKVNEKQQEEASKKTAMDNAESALNSAEQKKQNVENAKAEMDAKKDAYDKAKADLANCHYGEGTAAYISLANAVDVAEDAYNTAKSTYDAVKDTKPTDAEIQRLESEFNLARSAHQTAQAATQTARDELTSVQNAKTGAENKFKEAISYYSDGVRHYQHDLELYVDFQEVAKKEIAREAAAIKKQFTQINSNITELEAELNAIGVCLSNLKGYIEEYNEEVHNWESINNDYVANNASDYFSKQNEADIALTESQYNIESLETLEEYVKAIAREYRDFLDYIESPDRYKYGTVRIDSLETAEAVKGAVSAEVVNTLGDIVTVEKANAVFDSLYHGADGGDTPTIEMDNYYFVKDKVLPIQFLKYLNENFPEEAQNLTLAADPETGETAKPEEEYATVKEEMQGDKNGNEQINNDESGSGDRYGYTYKERTVDKNGLPSKGTGSTSNNNSNVNLKEDDDGVDVSSGLSDQNKNLGSVLSGIGDVLETGLENVYLVDYIFENFSYNTMVQEMMVEGEGVETYTDAISMCGNQEILGQYKGKARTLSNYNISATNNYLYGAEIEYILFGDSIPSNNVTYTKAGIYAIRFGFNAVFAFTDTEIRNTTQMAGLAVQAATYGIVPYQVVQIVLQLAIAAAESAIDLDMMSKGLDVVLVKTKETWTLSISGAKNFLADAAGSVVDMAVEKVADEVNKGITDVLNASAEELGKSVEGLTETVSEAVTAKGKEIIDNVYVELQSDLDEVLNKIQYMEFSKYDKETAKAEVADLFEQVKNEVNSYSSKFAGNEIAEALVPLVVADITGSEGVIEAEKQEILGIIDNTLDVEDIGDAVCQQMLQIKYDLIGRMQEAITDAEAHINDLVLNGIDEMTDYLKEQVDACTTEMTEAAAAEIKENISGKLNEFSEKYLNDPGASKVDLGESGGGEGKTTGKSVASMIKFGYKDYLMLFVFIGVCADDTAVLKRVGDLIQLNLSFDRKIVKGKEDVSGQVLISHKKGTDFKLSDAKTYVSVKSTVKLDMLFLDMDFFNRMLTDEGDDVESLLDTAATIPYKGLAGY